MKTILPLSIALAIFAWCMSLAMADAQALGSDEFPSAPMVPDPYGAGCVNCAAIHQEGRCINCSVVPPDHWHLLTKSQGGTVSLIKNLTEHECQFARAKVLGLAEREKRQKDFDECQSHTPGKCFWPTTIATDDYIVMAECFE